MYILLLPTIKARYNTDTGKAYKVYPYFGRKTEDKNKKSQSGDKI